MIEELKRKESGSVTDIIEMHVKEHGDTLITISELAKLTALSVEEIQEAAEELKQEGSVHCVKPLICGILMKVGEHCEKFFRCCGNMKLIIRTVME